MTDLFDYAEHYPDAPGFKARDTAIEAAEGMKPMAGRLRERCYAYLDSCSGGATADETAAALGCDILSIRPRFSELVKQDRIADTGRRRKNHSGRSAIVWRVSW